MVDAKSKVLVVAVPDYAHWDALPNAAAWARQLADSFRCQGFFVERDGCSSISLADADWLQLARGAIPQTLCGVAGNDRLPVGLTAIDDDTVGPAVSCHPFPFAGYGPLAPVEAFQPSASPVT